MSLDPNSFLCDDFKIKCTERMAIMAVGVLCADSSCTSYLKHRNDGTCVLCDGKCKGHRTGHTFTHRLDEDPDGIQYAKDIENYQCKVCGSKEFLTPFDAPSKEE